MRGGYGRRHISHSPSAPTIKRITDHMGNIFASPSGEEPIEDGFIQHGRGAGKRKLVFTSVDKAGQRVRRIATIDGLCRKIILIQPYEKSLYESGIREKGVPGYLYLFAHASARSIQGISIAEIGELASLIARSHIWNKEPVLIDACNAGAETDGIASRLAAALSTYVTAPTRLTWNYPRGGSAIGQGSYDKLPGPLADLPIPNLLRPGTWRTWGPDGTLTAETGTSPRDTGRVLPAAAAKEFAARSHGR